MFHVTIYTDGACSVKKGSKHGVGGWAAILQYGPHEKVLTGQAKETTNIRMEMTAVLEALRALVAPCKIDLYVDLELIYNAFERGWLKSWQHDGWVGYSGAPIANKDLWLQILHEASQHEIKVHHIKGHQGNELNERCDKLAVAAKNGAAL